MNKLKTIGMNKITACIAILFVVSSFSFSAYAAKKEKSKPAEIAKKEKSKSAQPAKKRRKKKVKIDWKTVKLVIQHLEKPVVVDGNVNDWKSTTPMPLPFMKKAKGSVSLGWNKNGLYGKVDIKDKKITINKNEPWKGDSFELFIEMDNQMKSNVSDYDPNAMHIAFFPDTINKKGEGFYLIIYGQNRMYEDSIYLPLKAEKQTANSKKDKIACAYHLKNGRGILEFFIPAQMLKPAIMKGRTPISLNFCLNDDGWPKEQFSTDKNVNNNNKHPNTWATVTFESSKEEKKEVVIEEEVETTNFTKLQTENKELDLEKSGLSISKRNEIISEAEDLMEADKISETIELLHKYVTDYPEDPYFLYNYGLALYRGKNYVSAEVIFNRAAIVNESPVINEALFQLGNTTYLQSTEINDGKQNWNKKIQFLRRSLDYYAQISNENNEEIIKRSENNKLMAVFKIADIFTKRANIFMVEALKIKENIDSGENKIWKVKDLVEELLKASGNAESDYRELETFIIENPSIKNDYSKLVQEGIGKINKILVFSLFTKAKITIKEVEEAGSTQNNNWTIQMYQTALSYYDQILKIEPKNEIALKEIASVKVATSNIYVAEANIELAMATDVVKEDIKERAMKLRVKELSSKTDRASLMEKDKLVSSLNYMEKAYPSSDPEDAIKHWLKAIGHFKTAISFNANNTKIKTNFNKLLETISDGRLRYAQRYMKDADKIKVTNDEEADNKVKILEKAVANFLCSIKETPEKKESLEVKINDAKNILSKAFYNRGQIYAKLAKEKRKTHLDRAVAYLQKATQDYTKSLSMNPKFLQAEKARVDNTKIQFLWRKELSQIVAERVKQEAKEMEESYDNEDSVVEFDESKLREMTIQDAGAPNKTYEENKMPEPMYNW